MRHASYTATPAPYVGGSLSLLSGLLPGSEGRDVSGSWRGSQRRQEDSCL